MVVAGSGRAADAIALALSGVTDVAKFSREFQSEEMQTKLQKIVELGSSSIAVFDIFSDNATNLNTLVMQSILSSYSSLSPGKRPFSLSLCLPPFFSPSPLPFHIVFP